MSKNFSINFKIVGMRITAGEIIRSMNEADWKFFEFITVRMDGLRFISGLHLDRAKETLGITEGTYYRKLKKFLDKGYLRKLQGGVYEIDTRRWTISMDNNSYLDKTKW